jgi:hypothetical protein
MYKSGPDEVNLSCNGDLCMSVLDRIVCLPMSKVPTGLDISLDFFRLRQDAFARFATRIPPLCLSSGLPKSCLRLVHRNLLELRGRRSC